jgi:hypothetical protein
LDENLHARLSHPSASSLFNNRCERSASSIPKSASSSPTLEAAAFIAPSALAILGNVVFLALLSFFCFRWPTATFAPDRPERLLLFVFLLVPTVDVPGLGAGENGRVGIGNFPHALILLLPSPPSTSSGPYASIIKKLSPSFALAPFFKVFFVGVTNVAAAGGDAKGSRRSIKSPSLFSGAISLNVDPGPLRVVDGTLLIRLLILAPTPTNAFRTADNLIVDCPRGVLGVELV